ncbi:two component transcriptional regulator, LuxR family [Anaerosphaera aminiphila DSM 21120]|uniref:Two component transcriptional regulator, LuxR family n=1 Tax=Anaerosphaera aminiphila DSM 21120 TaxID=1120995 RepID=A0A1M5V314_9FIRM|nr:response regulator transcription factor [Anaerosphaera aminiphila]SHH69657.1 two component transcriptional regulator, LuxR family [Anaerosphaera aminiphila DSM 21120]
MKILIFDDHTLFGQSMVKLLNEYSFMEISFCNTEKELFKSLRDKIIDILLLDINLKDRARKNGIELVKDLLIIYPDLKIIILSSYDLPIYKKTAFEYGAKGFLNKSMDVDELVDSIKKVYQSEFIAKFEAPIEALTNREIEVIKALSTGKKRELIAKDLYISERTLYNHINNIYEKFGVDNIIEAYNCAMELGYLEPKF